MRMLGASLSGALLVAVFATPGLAQDRYPSHPVKIIVPTSPGAVTDTLARAAGQGLSEAWGQPVIIDNKPGADEMVGNDIVAKSAPDGYTLGVVSNAGITAAPYLHSALQYDPQKDFTPIFMLGEVTPVMMVSASTPVQTVPDLIAFAKARPGELNYGSFGNGTYPHIAMEEFKRRTGTELTHIIYRGATPAYLALARNEISIMIVNLAGAMTQVDGGHARIIAAAGGQRSKLRPELPTIAEGGLPGFATGAWWGMFGPGRLPGPLVAKIRADVSRVVSSPDVQKIYATNTIVR
jgi:tripartite-type tricarboxylate transporter receptor subunit TctC